MYKPMLTVMVGLSASGKSTIAKTELQSANTVIISTDDIREELTGSVQDQSKNDEVFRLFHQRIRRNLEDKKNVIADATNITMESRRAILNTVNGLNIIKRCYLIPKPFEQCIHDNLDRKYPVQDGLIAKQRMKFQLPFMEEGWNVIKIDNRFGERQIDISVMQGFDQKNPYHDLDLYQHCMQTYDLFRNRLDTDKKYYLGALLHDFGKMYCQSFEKDGIAHYYQHHCISAYQLISSFPYPETLDSAFLANYHMMPFDWDTEKTREKWKNWFGIEKYNMLMAFHECDIAAR